MVEFREKNPRVNFFQKKHKPLFGSGTDFIVSYLALKKPNLTTMTKRTHSIFQEETQMPVQSRHNLKIWPYPTYFQLEKRPWLKANRAHRSIPAAVHICTHLYTVELCWLAAAVASSPEAQRTSLFLLPSLRQHFHIPSRSLTPPLSSPPLSAALASLQPCFKRSVLHLLFHPHVWFFFFSCSSAALFNLIQRVLVAAPPGIQNETDIIMLKTGGEKQVEWRKKGIVYFHLWVLPKHSGSPIGGAGSPAGTIRRREFHWKQLQLLDLY